MKSVSVLTFLLICFTCLSFEGIKSKGAPQVLKKSSFSSLLLPNSGQPYLNAGADLLINCGTRCATLTASYSDVGRSTSYEVTQIPFTPPIAFNGLANSLNPDIDDSWSGIETIPFDFCFFDKIESQFQIGSNGVIRFDVDPNDIGLLSNDWMFSQTIPNNTVEALSEASIFTPGHDLNPTASESEEIGWEISGVAPFRMLVVSYYNVPMYGCDWLEATHMAVFYETTNIIEIYIKSSPTCSANNASAVVGIQNNAGDRAYFPRGRNTDSSPWTAVNEAWRFTPSGESVVDFAWLDEFGTIIGTTPVLEICPTEKTTYTARVIYTACNGKTVELRDEVVVDVKADEPPKIDMQNSYALCVDPIYGEVMENLVLDTGLTETNYRFSWFYENDLMSLEKKPELEIMKRGNYRVEVVNTQSGCSNSFATIVVESSAPQIEVNSIKVYNNKFDLHISTIGNGDYEYNLNGDIWQKAPLFRNVPRGRYEVMARDLNGCGITAIHVLAIDYLRFFTPNNDGFNDFWMIEASPYLENQQIYIYDRYGKFVVKLTSDAKGWDGTLKGVPMPASDYWFTIFYTDSVTKEHKEFRGNFSLKR